MAADNAGSQPRPLEAAALIALAQPARFQLWESLDEHGPATTTQLAAQIDASPEAVGSHLRELERHGLIERWEQKWRRRSGAFSFQPHLFENDPRTAEAARFLENELIRMHSSRLHKWLAVSRTMPLEWREASYDGSVSLRLTRDELAELGSRMVDVIMDYRRRHDHEGGSGGERLATVEVFFHAFPIGLDPE